MYNNFNQFINSLNLREMYKNCNRPRTGGSASPIILNAGSTWRMPAWFNVSESNSWERVL